MKQLAITSLILTLGLAGPVFAGEHPIKMRFSGSGVPTSIVMQPNTITDEDLLEGHGTLGSFTFRELHADLVTPQPSPACSGANLVSIRVVASGGVFRFEDGSLLTVVGIVEQGAVGALCIDLSAAASHLTETYQVTGGTGRFKSVSGGTLTLSATQRLVLRGASNPVLLSLTGVIEGTLERED